MPTWLNPRTAVVHAVTSDRSRRTRCGCIRLPRPLIRELRFDPTGELSEEYADELRAEIDAPWVVCSKCMERT